MSRLTDLYRQLKNRKVIRTAVVYLAVFWASIEVADLLAGAEMLGEQYVRWLLFTGVAGFPLILLLSWFLEAPWRERRGLSVLGDVAIILAISVVAVLLAWQQFFTSLTRPVIAVVHIEPTDARADTPYLASHLEQRFRMLLATRPEIRVIELESSLHPGLADFSPARRAAALGADFLLAGTVNQGSHEIRLSIQLFDGKGNLAWSDRFEERMLDQSQLQSRVLNALWPELPMPKSALKEARSLIMACEYPADEEAIRRFIEAAFLARGSPQAGTAALNELISEFPDNGLLILQRARSHFQSLNSLMASRKSVAHSLGMNDLARVAEICLEHPDAELLRLAQTRQLNDQVTDIDSYLWGHPNAAGLMLAASRVYLEVDKWPAALALADQAWQLNPLAASSFCHYKSALELTDSGESARRLADMKIRVASLSDDLAPTCP
jgi:TolB-like protein